MTQKQYKKHVKHILKSIKKAFDISDSVKEYENLCECIYFSDCKLNYTEFSRIKKLVFLFLYSPAYPVQPAHVHDLEADFQH